MSPATTPDCYSRLTKKTCQLTPTLVTTQTVLMKMLGLTSSSKVESGEFAHYLEVFRDGLTEEQVEMIRDLFKAAPPALVDITEEEAAVD
jgi:hypothetical protein